MSRIKPMLATQFDEARVVKQLPVFVQPKFDGIRAMLYEGRLVSRSFKPIPNKHIRAMIEAVSHLVPGLDGELIIGEPTDPDVYRMTNSAVMSQGGTPDFRFYAFDYAYEHLPYHERKRMVELDLRTLRGAMPWAHTVETVYADNLEAVFETEKRFLFDGYEGAILRRPNAHYKFGRATPAQGQLIKLKQFVDTEGVVIGFEELFHNDNEAFQNELGYTTRSAHQENKRAGGMLGKLVVKGIFPKGLEDFGGGIAAGDEYETRLGSGFTVAERKQIWENQQDYLGQTVKFKFMPVGVKDKPRHPIFLGWRHGDDM